MGGSEVSLCVVGKAVVPQEEVGDQVTYMLFETK